VTLGFERGRAQALAAAVTILHAMECAQDTPDADLANAPDTSSLLQEIQAVSQVLRSPEEIKAVRTRAAVPAESMSTHE
jgi:hypothetical protein